MGHNPQNPASTRKALDQLAKLSDDAGRRKFFARHRPLATANFAKLVTEAVVPHGRIETPRAMRLAEAALFLSHKLREKPILGLSLRAKGNALNLAGQNQDAIDCYQKALHVFKSLNDQHQIARTLTNSVQALILLGKYDRAFATASRARSIFTRLGETRRLARLENNVGNIFHRQDRFEEALACYEHAYEQLVPYGDSEELAVALSNVSMCLTMLNNFPRVLATYERARALCGDGKMPVLREQIDYNIAYLYYLQGEHRRAIEMLRGVRQRCETTGDRYHFALCHLDLAEIYLELNLSTEASAMARQGQLQFRKLGMRYEEAKCQAFEALAFSQLGKAVYAMKLFVNSRAKFVREKNLVWPNLIDLYQALLLFKGGRLSESRRLGRRAAAFFDHSFLPAKTALCHLLLARVAFRHSDLPAARDECQRAFDRLAGIEAPVLLHEAHFLLGEIQQASQDPAAAYQSYQRARRSLETLRGNLPGEELRISFMKNRLGVYERLVEICLSDATRPNAAEESFRYMELAKSRSLAELLAQEGHAAEARETEVQAGVLLRTASLRRELNDYYRRIEYEQLRSGHPSRERIEGLQKKARTSENELLRTARETAPPESDDRVAPDGGLNFLEVARQALPPGAALVEYFSLSGRFVAAVVTSDSLKLVPLACVSRVTNLLHLLGFQISKFRLRPDYVRAFEELLLEAAQTHLADLYRDLIAPLREGLSAEHLIIVPHGILHYVPFHALFDGQRYLIDSVTISYAPSASVFARCQRKPSSASSASLVVGVPDARAPFIRDEAESVARALTNSQLVLGAEPSEIALREKGPHSRLIHIATHGQFRRDNPSFSGIRLGSGYLSLYDLYQMKLDADFVALSGCSTGMNVVAAGDELLGLMRGLLHAGARSLLLTLWDVHDRSTADFMACFYRNLGGTKGTAFALQQAMQEVRASRPHPYYWAPFVLVGKI